MGRMGRMEGISFNDTSNTTQCLLSLSSPFLHPGLPMSQPEIRILLPLHYVGRYVWDGIEMVFCVINR